MLILRFISGTRFLVGIIGTMTNAVPKVRRWERNFLTVIHSDIASMTLLITPSFVSRGSLLGLDTKDGKHVGNATSRINSVIKGGARGFARSERKFELMTYGVSRPRSGHELQNLTFPPI